MGDLTDEELEEAKRILAQSVRDCFAEYRGVSVANHLYYDKAKQKMTMNVIDPSSIWKSFIPVVPVSLPPAKPPVSESDKAVHRAIGISPESGKRFGHSRYTGDDE